MASGRMIVAFRYMVTRMIQNFNINHPISQRHYTAFPPLCRHTFGAKVWESIILFSKSEKVWDKGDCLLFLRDIKKAVSLRTT